MSTQPKFTDLQIENWREYERIRTGGRYNMFDPRARIAAGLTSDEYGFCMDKYDELREAAESPPAHRQNK